MAKGEPSEFDDRGYRQWLRESGFSEDPQERPQRARVLECHRCHHAIGRLTSEGFWLKGPPAQPGFYFRPDRPSAPRGEVPAHCRKCGITGVINLGKAANAARGTTKAVRVRIRRVYAQR